MTDIEKIDKIQSDCVECFNAQIRLVRDIVKLKNFIVKHKPNPYSYKKTIEAHRQYERDFKEWDDLMRL